MKKCELLGFALRIGAPVAKAAGASCFGALVCDIRARDRRAAARAGQVF